MALIKYNYISFCYSFEIIFMTYDLPSYIAV